MAVPRDLDPEIQEIEDIYLYTIDDLEKVVLEGQNKRNLAAVEADEIIIKETIKYSNTKKAEEVEGKRPFLKWLKPDKRTYSWEEVAERIYKLTTKIKSLIKQGDRCLILSENRPYWLMTDIAIMNAGGISVPIFTTYSANDYEYILNDCKPSLIFVSNQDQLNKIKNIENSFLLTMVDEVQKNANKEKLLRKPQA